MKEFLNQTYFNNTLSNYLLSLLVFITSILIITVSKHFLLKRLSDWAEKTTSNDYMLVRGIKKYSLPLTYFGAFYLSIKILYLNPTLNNIVNFAALAFIIILGAILSSSFVIFLLDKYWKKTNKDFNNKLALKWITIIIKALIWIIAIVLFCQNVGIQIGGLIAGLGIGGVAIAFAAQAVLEDIFSFITIFFDRPFEMGDFIVAGDHMGTVEHIGIKTTRLRSIGGEQLIFSNKDLTNSRVRNYKRMEKRRVLFTLRVTYNTPLDKLKEIPDLIKNMIVNIQDTTFDRAHFTEYADYSLNFEIAYYVLSSDYNKYMDIQQNINFLIKEAFDKHGIEFAIPTRTFVINNGPQKLDTKLRNLNEPDTI